MDKFADLNMLIRIYTEDGLLVDILGSVGALSALTFLGFLLCRNARLLFRVYGVA